ncbi:YqcC family protein [Shewanella sp. 10N.286.54.B9]|uniref:YqcC family protein n=1 Tax=Shewanella sp. 10N.286.54.B9 TaxID=3229719 RepID=UPI003553E8C7
MITVKTRELLVALEAELAAQNLLSIESPTKEALTSSAPFSCDVMPFEQWLQFIFLPKMHTILDSNLSLPNAISIAPMAQHVWQGETKYQTLVGLIQAIDSLLNGNDVTKEIIE